LLLLTTSWTISYGRDGFGERPDSTITQTGSTLGTLSYEYDKLGRITHRDESLPGSSLDDSYQYNPAGYLISATRNGQTTTWQYDSNGNRTHENGAQIATYDEQDRLLSYQGVTYSHTANGERQSKTEGGATTTYEYDELGNLLKVTLPGDVIIDYVVDGQNRRIGKKVNGSLTQGFLYQDQLNPVAELDGNGNISARFIYADKANVPAYMVKDGNTYRIISDHLGSPDWWLMSTLVTSPRGWNTTSGATSPKTPTPASSRLASRVVSMISILS
jgi:YD repeat-containing protein